MTVAAETRAKQSAGTAFRGGVRDFVIALLIMAVLGGAIFLTVLRRVTFIEVGYEIRKLEKAESRLLHQRHEMEIEKAMLSSPERIERVARERFGLREPEPGQIRVLP